jgi:hypothetical protein
MIKEAKSFGERNFGHAELGDVRRNRRLVDLADRMAHRPGGTLPEKINSPRDLKAMYRFFDASEVTHDAILEAHQDYLFTDILPSREGFTLAIHDSTEFEYTKRESLEDLGKIGNGFRRGYIGHNTLLACPETGAAIGLANQILHRRVSTPKSETASKRKKRSTRESLVWLKGARVLPGNKNIVDVCDRGADTSEFINYEMRSGRTFVIRSSQKRNCFAGHQERTGEQATKLHNYASEQESAGSWTLEVTSKKEFKSKKRKGKKRKVVRRKRTATMSVSFAPIRIRTATSKKVAADCVWVVRVWEANPPKGQERLEWFLLTNHPVQTFEDAHEVVGWYEKRWIIEEYHKCLKTGMNIESYQFTSTSRLEPAIALTSIAAITLLKLRDDSRNEATQDLPATDYIDNEYVEILSMWRHGKTRLDWTVREFVLALARISGHQNRRGDHPPGWQKLWKGWHELQAMLAGARMAKKMKICG